MSVSKDTIRGIVLKHLPGQHEQKRHGWRYRGGLRDIRQSMRRNPEIGERDEYRKRVDERGYGPQGWAGKLERGTRPRPEYAAVPKKTTAELAMAKILQIDDEYKSKIDDATKELIAARGGNNPDHAEMGRIQSRLYELEESMRFEASQATKPVNDHYLALIEAHKKKQPPKVIYTRDERGYISDYKRTSPSVLAKWKREYNDISKSYSKALDDARRSVYENNPEWKRIKRETDNSNSARLDRVNQAKEKVDKLTAEKTERQLKVLEVTDRASVSYIGTAFRDEGKRKTVAEGMEAFNRLVSSKVATGTVGGRSKSGSRASCSLEKESINLTKYSGVSTWVHEMGHWLEKTNPTVFTKALLFREERTAGEASRWLGSLTGIRGYGRDEVAKKDNFVEPYMGKVYSRFGQHYATEITSMGLQMFYENPAKLAREDPGYFSFIFGLVRGE